MGNSIPESAHNRLPRRPLGNAARHCPHHGCRLPLVPATLNGGVVPWAARLPRAAFPLFPHDVFAPHDRHPIAPTRPHAIPRPYTLAQYGDFFRNVYSREAHWEIDYYATSPNPHDGLSMSIGRTPTRTTALLRCSQPMTTASCPLKPLTRPVAAWLYGAHAA